MFFRTNGNPFKKAMRSASERAKSESHIGQVFSYTGPSQRGLTEKKRQVVTKEPVVCDRSVCKE